MASMLVLDREGMQAKVIGIERHGLPNENRLNAKFRRDPLGDSLVHQVAVDHGLDATGVLDGVVILVPRVIDRFLIAFGRFHSTSAEREPTGEDGEMTIDEALRLPLIP